MASARSMLTIEDIRSFHTIDRDIYSRLVIDLQRDLLQSMEVISMWMLLTEVGYPNLILKMIHLPNLVLNELAEEAVLCLVTVAANAPPPPPIDSFTQLSMTRSLLEDNQYIHLNYFHQNRERAIFKILRISHEVCKIVFDDIVQQVLSSSSNVNLVGPASGPNPAALAPPAVRQHRQFSPLSAFGRGNTSILPNVGPASGVYHGVGGLTLEVGISSTSSALNPMAEPYNPTSGEITNDEIIAEGEELIPADDKTLFVTFSRGYLIPERDVHDFFTRTFGNCVERILLQEVEVNEQALFARVVLKSAFQVGDILQGRERVRFSINGRHIHV